MPLLTPPLLFNPVIEREFLNAQDGLHGELSRCEIRKNAVKRPESLLQAMMGQNTVEALDTDVPGDAILADLRAVLACFPFHKFQEIFIELFVQSTLPKIYGKDFHDHEYRIRKENNIEFLYMYSLLCCTRRLGKTYTASAFTAAAAVAIPDITITIFSPSARQSGFMLEEVRRQLFFLRDHHGYEFEIAKGGNNTEHYSIVRDGSTRHIRALPGKPEVSEIFCCMGIG